jgi:hypothetical protein
MAIATVAKAQFSLHIFPREGGFTPLDARRKERIGKISEFRDGMQFAALFHEELTYL